MQFCQQKKIETLFQHINGLQEENDQSREEQCMSIVGDNNFTEKNRQFSQSSIHSRNSINKTQSRTILEEVERLKMINKQLVEDNQKLLKYCIKLKTESTYLKGVERENDSQLKAIKQKEKLIFQLKNEIVQLEKQNCKLKKDMLSFTQKQSDCHEKSVQNFTNLVVNEYSTCNNIGEAQKITKKKNSNFQNSTQDTSSTEKERDRQIANMKIIYETQIKSLKNEMKKNEEEIKRLKVNQKIQSLSPKAKTMRYGSYVQRHNK